VSGLGGRTLAGRYRLERLIGRGGMGSVYEAVQTDLGRRVAVKLLEDVDARAVARFRAEALAAASVASPHVAVVFDFQTNEGEPPFLVMELLDGAPLSSVIAREGLLEARRAVAIAIAMLDALGAAHAARLVHRDVKPSNVMLVGGGPGGEGERVKVVDFGIAKLLDDESGVRTTTGSIMGTPAYLPPEQVEGGGVDARTDLHAVGLVLYEMCSGARPWPAQGPERIIALLREPAPSLSIARPDLPASLVAVVARALEKDKEARYPSAEAMRAALVAAGKELGAGKPARAAVTGGEPSAAAAPLPRRRRRASPFALGLGVTLTVGTIAAGVLVATRSSRDAAPAATAEAAAAADAEAEADAEAAADADADAEAGADAGATDRRSALTPPATTTADDAGRSRAARSGPSKRSGCICRWEWMDLCPRPMPSQGCYCYPRDRRQTFAICKEPYSRSSGRCPRMVVGDTAGAPCSGFGPNGTTVEGRLVCEVCYEPFERTAAVPETPCRGVTVWGEERDGLWHCP